MSIPTYDAMLRPILVLAAEQPVSRRSIAETMPSLFNLTPEETASRIPSGASTYVQNRSGWAMTFLTKAGLIEKVASRRYAATAAGRAFLERHPERITTKDLAALDGWHEAWQRKSNGGPPPEPVSLTETPLETLDRAVTELNADVRARLLDAILKQSPVFFEELVLDVLVAMGYGSSRAEAAKRLGQSGDEGIDGRINQDPLGLDQIMVQAKRYAPDRVIDRNTIQAFIGSLAGQGVTKGIFITTSYFAASAAEFVSRGSNTKVVLIDGASLLDLMMRHHIGVRVERQIELLDLDQNYFEDAE